MNKRSIDINAIIYPLTFLAQICLPWMRWVRAFAVVDFDTEHGQRLLASSVIPRKASPGFSERDTCSPPTLRKPQSDEAKFNAGEDEDELYEAELAWGSIVNCSFPDTSLDGNAGQGMTGGRKKSQTSSYALNTLSFEAFRASQTTRALSPPSRASRLRSWSRERLNRSRSKSALSSEDSAATPSSSPVAQRDRSVRASNHDRRAGSASVVEKSGSDDADVLNDSFFGADSASLQETRVDQVQQNGKTFKSAGAIVEGSPARGVASGGVTGADYASQVYFFRQNVRPDNAGAEFWLGFVYFRQQPDARIHRGYAMQSVVLLTELPFVALFSRVIEMVGCLWWSEGAAALECAYQNILTWPDLDCCFGAVNIMLPFLGDVLEFIPPKLNMWPEEAATDGRNSLLDLDCGCGVRHQIELAVTTNWRHQTPPLDSNTLLVTEDCGPWNAVALWKYFGGSGLSKAVAVLHLVWELVLTGEPILVLAESPSDCASIVTAMVQSITPLSYRGDFRPFITIDDPAFMAFSASDVTPSQIVLGATNPIFEKTMAHWPFRFVFRQDGADAKAYKFAYFTSSSKTLTKTADRSFVQKLKACNDDNARNNALQNHMTNLTLRFLAPIRAYVRSLAPSAASLRWPELDIWRGPPQLRDVDFQAMLEECVESKFAAEKDKCRALYEKFFASSTFAVWLAATTEIERAKIRDAYVAGIFASNIGLIDAAQNRDQDEVLALYNRLRAIARLPITTEEAKSRQPQQRSLATRMLFEESQRLLLLAEGLKSLLDPVRLQGS